MNIFLYLRKVNFYGDDELIDNNISPFIKWAGGKRQLLPYIKEKMPLKYKII